MQFTSSHFPPIHLHTILPCPPTDLFARDFTTNSVGIIYKKIAANYTETKDEVKQDTEGQWRSKVMPSSGARLLYRDPPILK
jgi:hypothetical protein